MSDDEPFRIDYARDPMFANLGECQSPSAAKMLDELREAERDIEQHQRVGLPFTALAFAANAHKHQRRKGARREPYINHIVRVVSYLALAGIQDVNILSAAALHDVIEDTSYDAVALRKLFPPAIVYVVKEVTDDKSLPYEERKRLQIAHAPDLSRGAKAIKIADKIDNVRSLVDDPPDWPPERKTQYLHWSCCVVAGCQGVWPALDRHWDAMLMGHCR
jgi:guanosine-3',5'-bis(diphosphate) 3'-pyrophosphohydrolase